ncbi:MAG TPA: restriction endonuclease subunit S [Firmicutes bacterium]|nr:restriction endonuclease subunit S [Bacillota bacterium]
MRKMKDSGIEWIGEIPEEWGIIKCKYILSVNTGGVWGDEPKLDGTDKVVLRSTEQTIDGYWQIENPAQRNLTGINLSDYLIKPGDLLITKSSGSELHIGKTTLADGYFLNHECYYSNFIQRIRCDGYASKLMWYLLNSSISREQFIYIQNSTSGLGNINSESISGLYLPIMSTFEQTRIAEYLDDKCGKIDRYIETQRAIIEKLKAYKQAVITEAVTKGLDPTVPMKDSGVEWIGEIPQGWERIKLKDICAFHNGDRSSNYPSPDEFIDEGIPFLGAESLENFYVDVSKAKHISMTKYNSMGGLKIQKNDILYTLRGSTIGKNAIASFSDGTVASSLMGIRAGERISAEFLLYWMNSFCEYIQRDICINGSTAPNLSAENVKMFILYLPTFEEQLKISAYLKESCTEIDNLINNKKLLIDKLTEYKKSLIYEAVTGKKEV